MTDTTISESIIRYAATLTDEAVLDPRNGYYPFPIVAEAFEKGFEQGKEDYKVAARKKLLVNFDLTIDYINDILGRFSKIELSPIKLFVNISFDTSKIILSFKESEYIRESFLDNAYIISSDIQLESFEKGFNISLSYLVDSESIDFQELQSDGFNIALDLATKNNVYGQA